MFKQKTFTKQIWIGKNNLDEFGIPDKGNAFCMEKKREQTIESQPETIGYLENMLNYAKAPIVVWNSQYKIKRFNRAFEQLTGRTEKNLIGLSLGILFPAASRDSSMELIRETLESGQTEVIEINVLHIDGSVLTLLWNSKNIMDSDGKTPAETLSQCHDITERIQADLRLKEKKEYIEEQNKKFIQINKELEYQNNEKEKRAAELILANIELAFQNQEKEKRAVELIIANKELAFQNEEKEKRAAELTIAKEKAEESDRLKSAFLANMSHEIRTPLNGILGFTDLLKDQHLSGENQLVFIGIIEQCGARMLKTIDNIIDISKIESGLMEVSNTKTNINGQIDKIYKYFKPEAEKKGIQIFTKNSLSTNKAIINTDDEKVYVVLTNLVNNAIKFTKKGSVEFGYSLKTAKSETKVKQKQVELEFFVKDTGIGIHPERQEIVFERFCQSNDSLNRKYEGAGLGLSISKAFVELLGGRIWVESEYGKGTTIYFTIPYNSYPKKSLLKQYK